MSLLGCEWLVRHDQTRLKNPPVTHALNLSDGGLFIVTEEKVLHDLLHPKGEPGEKKNADAYLIPHVFISFLASTDKAAGIVGDAVSFVDLTQGLRDKNPMCSVLLRTSELIVNVHWE